MSARQPTAAGAGAAKGGSKTGGVPLWYLLPLRVAIGGAFLHASAGKLGVYLANNELRGALARSASGNPVAFMQQFLSGKAQLWSEPIAYLLAYGELVVGVALVLGLFTRGASAAGATIVGAYLLAAGHTAPGLYALGLVGMVALGTLAAAGAGRVVGCDGWLHRRAPVMPFTLLY